MNKEKRLENAKKLSNLMTNYARGKDIQKYAYTTWVTITESFEIEKISISNIETYRVKPNFRACKDKKEFIELFIKDTENLGLMEKSTGTLCTIYRICDNFVKIIKRGQQVELTYDTLFEKYIFYNRGEAIIGIEIK